MGGGGLARLISNGANPKSLRLQCNDGLNSTFLPCYITFMSTVEDIENAVAELAPEDLAKFRAWFEQFDAARFDRKIERAASSGKLDRLADDALVDFRSGRAREL